MSFNEFNISAELIKGLEEDGITEPTQIQIKSLPHSLAGEDIIGMSRTGSGKTLAFGIPVLERIEVGAGPQAIVLAPTRELAVQISKNFQKWGQYIGVTVATVFGGIALGPQVDEMAACEIICATPGRMLDHLQRENVDLSNMFMFCLDEADKMVDMGFIEDVEKIIQATGEKRQILLFGATISGEIEGLRDRYMTNPVVAKAELQVKEDLLEQYYYEIKPYEKFSMLMHILKNEKRGRTIIFCSARSTVEIVTRNLKAQKINAEMIHGKLSQNKRLSTIEGFNKGKTAVLVASAVAARGLHIDDVTHVINYDLSKDPQEYIHRIGRTARAGEQGKAITLLCDRDYEAFRDILNKYPVDITKMEVPKLEKYRFETRRNDDRGRGGGGFRGGGNRSGGYKGGNDRRGGSRGPSRGRSDSSRSSGRSEGRSSSRSSNSSGALPDHMEQSW
jgi:superfamily II DNA/RNA helicase